MPNTSRDTVLCRYHYDPLDRQNGCTVLEQPVIQRFHCKDRLATEIQGFARWSILQHDDQLLAQQNHLDTKVSTTLLATDQQRSILNALDAAQPNPLAYTPFGHRSAESGLLSLLGFNGERPDPVTGHYHLGNGYRQFNPVLMRFNSPDSWSPFGEGGVNAYAYCGGDPGNRVDPTGHSFLGSLFKGAKNLIGVRHPSKFHKQNIDNILNGAQLNYGKNVIVDSLKPATLQPINLEKTSKNKITQYIGAINADSSPIYDTIKQHLYSMEVSSTLSNKLQELTSHHRVLTHAQIMDVPKHKLAIELAKSVEFNKNIKTAKNLLPKKAARTSNADNALSSQNTDVRSS